MMSLREILRLPPPLLIFNGRSGNGTIFARAGNGISAQEAASDISQDCCPSCILYYTRNPERNAFCTGMRIDTEIADVTLRGSSPSKAVTEILLLSECAPRT